jgi:hypothetical protein
MKGQSQKMNTVLIIFFYFLQIVFGETDQILDKIHRCLPNEKFDYIRYISGQKASDDNFYQKFSYLEITLSKLTGIHDR